MTSNGQLGSFDSYKHALLESDINGERSVGILSLDVTSADTLLKDGFEKFSEKVAALRLSTITYPDYPSVEVRFKNLRLSVDVNVDTSGKEQIPTLATAINNAIIGKFRSKSIKTVPILRDITGTFRPATLTLLLGQPESGKSALMKMLSNKFPITNRMSKQGEVSYNGVPLEEIDARISRYVSYVGQTDLHYPNVTVLETFKFAHECLHREANSKHSITEGHTKAALYTLESIAEVLPEFMCKLLGLDHCKHSFIGDAMLRGISGGEKKRVTTGECLFGRKNVLLLDEISTGLDSAATYDIVKTLKTTTRTLKTTVVISLLQPPPEVYDLFDDICLMNQGEILYHGPRELALPHFQSLGYECPVGKVVADFLLDIASPKQVQYQNVAPSKGIQLPTTSHEFAVRFKDTQLYKHMIQDLEVGFNIAGREYERDYMMSRSQYAQSYTEGLRTVFKRQVQMTIRDKPFFIGRAIMVFITALLYGTAFWQIDDANPQVMFGFLFSSVLFIALGQAPQLSKFMGTRDVLYKQQAQNLFRTSAYSIAAFVMQIPLALFEAIVYGSTVYWMCGLASDWYRFLTFLIILFILNLSFCGFFFLLSAIAPDLTIAKPLSMLNIILITVFAGFIITQNHLPKYWIWIYWLSPVSWAFSALAINQYKAAKFQVCEYSAINYCTLYNKTFSDYALHLYDIKADSQWIIYSILYMIIATTLLLYMSTVILDKIRYQPPKTVQVESNDENGSKNGSIDAKNEHLQQDDSEIITISVPPPSIPVTLAFVDLWYSVKLPAKQKDEVHLLKGVSGYALPGTMTALMGSSGAGKTTLMDVIACRKTGGRIQGKILLNGHPASELALRRCAGYCEQMDVHSQSSTIREALTFSAFLRQSDDIPREDKLISVQHALDLLQLNNIADNTIRGLSNEQMKRVTIGVELTALPSILFLDEPTSGLDARAAKHIMTGVRNIARTGRTVICTIHQPSPQVFALFDHLLLLKRGGETVFFGESSKMVNYFQSIPGTKPLEAGHNPATWMLEVIGAGVGNHVATDFAEIYQQSQLKAITAAALNHQGVGVPYLNSDGEIVFKKKRAASFANQLYFLGLRFARLHWRTPSYNVTRYAVMIIFAIIFGSIYIGTDYSTFSGVNAGVGMIFLSTAFVGITAAMSVLPVMYQERQVYYRERASQTYNAFIYFLVAAVMEIPYVYSSTLIFTAIFFPFVGFSGCSEFFWYWLVLGTYVLLYIYLGQTLSYGLPNIAFAALCSSLFNTIFTLFSGFNPPTYAIPQPYKWLYKISAPAYATSILSANIFARCPNEGDTSYIGCRHLANAPPMIGNNATTKVYVESIFKMEYDSMLSNYGILIAITLVIAFVGMLCLRFTNHQQR